MLKNSLIFLLSLMLVVGVAALGSAAKVPAPTKGGDGFTAVNLEKAKELVSQGGTVVACHSHTTDFMKGHPDGTIHITCLVPKDHKRVDMPLDLIDFDVTQLPQDKNAPLLTYCASDT